MNRSQIQGFLASIAVLWLLHSSPSQSADISVNVPASMVTSGIEQEITRYLQFNSSNFDWLPGTFRRVDASATGRNENVMRVQLNLQFETLILGIPTDVPVNVSFLITFDCSARGPFLNLSRTMVSVPGSPVPANVVRDIQAEASQMLRNQTREIIDRLWQSLTSVGEPNPVCPHFVISSRGDIRAELDFARGCINGRTRKEACGAGTIGDGLDFTCRNGRWRRTGGVCEPATPPGGHPR